ncbi:MAG: hypothetical protein ACM359_20930, partial [Bacillota bacterium]
GCLVVALGCSNKTETGYEPRKLGDSWAVQRGYYATPFSPEARQAEADQDISFRRPTDWRP